MAAEGSAVQEAGDISEWQAWTVPACVKQRTWQHLRGDWGGCGPGGYLGPETVQSPIVTPQLITQQDKEAREDSMDAQSDPLQGYACRLPKFINCRGQKRMKTDKHKCSQGLSLRDWEIAEFD